MRLPGSRLTRRVLIASGVIAALTGLYAAAGFVLVPRVLRSELTGFVSTRYHRTLTLGPIHFNPFTLRLELAGVSFPDADSLPMLGADRLTIVASAASLWRRGASLSEIVLEGPFVRALIRPDGSLNLADLAKPFARPARAPTPASASPARVFIDRLAIVQGRASFADARPASAFSAELRPINFELAQFATVGTAPGHFSLQCATTRGEQLRTDGALAMQPLGLDGHLEISNLQARTLWRAVRNAVPVEVASGVIGIQGQYHLAELAGAPDLAIDLTDLGVTDLGLKSPGAASDAVDLKHIDVAGTHFAWARRSIVIDRIRLDGGTIRAWVNADGSTSFADWMRAAPASGSSGTPARGPAARPWSFAAPDIAVSGLAVSAEDRRLSPAATLEVSRLGIAVRGFRTPGAPTLDLSAQATVGQSGEIRATASYALGSGAAHAKLTAADIDLTALQPYLAQRTALALLSGELGTRVTADRGTDGALAVDADVDVTGLRTVDDALRQDFVRWRALKLIGIRYRTRPASLHIAQILADRPYARVIIRSDRKLNLAEAFAPRGSSASPTGSTPASATAAPAAAAPAASAPAAASTPSAATPFPVAIGAVKILDASARYTDLWIEPHFTLNIRSLGGAITGLSSKPGAHAKVELDGKVDQYAPLQITGELDPFAATRYLNLKMNFHGVELTTVSPYSAYFAGYKIEKGTVSADIDYHIDNGQLAANHHFVIDQLQLGERVTRPGGSSLPLKLAVALLKDRHGVIDLGLPVSGSLSDPKFRIGPLIWKVLVNLVVKAATAPFALLGNLFGGGEQIKYVDFDAGSARLDASDTQRLDAIGKALAQRPGLKLDVPSGYTAALDGVVLRAQLVRAKLLERAQRELASGKQAHGALDPALLEDPAEHFRLLLEEYRAELGAGTALPPPAEPAAQALGKRHRRKGPPPPPLDPAIDALQAALEQHLSVSESDFAALGRRRSAAVQKALLSGGQIDPGRLFVLAPAPTAQQDSRVRLVLALK